jgi:hypothetical protein
MGVMRAKRAAVLGAWLCVALGTLAFAQERPAAPATTVRGSNNPVSDVPAVQSAVDQGGMVTLKGVFDFGDNGSVTITKDVEVIGKTDDPATPRPKIKGGYVTFRSVRSPASAAVDPKIAIENIDFEGASWTPIYIAHASGVTAGTNESASWYA